MSDNVVSLLFAALLLGVPIVGGGLAWMAHAIYNAAGPKERRRVQKARNDLLLERERRQLELDLMLQEWQHTKSLEDLERHRRRLEGELDNMHQDSPEADVR